MFSCFATSLGVNNVAYGTTYFILLPFLSANAEALIWAGCVTVAGWVVEYRESGPDRYPLSVEDNLVGIRSSHRRWPFCWYFPVALPQRSVDLHNESQTEQAIVLGALSLLSPRHASWRVAD